VGGRKDEQCEIGERSVEDRERSVGIRREISGRILTVTYM
jgi:hypothetical protein